MTPFGYVATCLPPLQARQRPTRLQNGTILQAVSVGTFDVLLALTDCCTSQLLHFLKHSLREENAEICLVQNYRGWVRGGCLSRGKSGFRQRALSQAFCCWDGQCGQEEGRRNPLSNHIHTSDGERYPRVGTNFITAKFQGLLILLSEF